MSVKNQKKWLLLDENGVSEVVGFILVFSIITLAIAIIYVVGYPAIEDSKDRTQLKNMEKNFIVLQSNIEMVAFGESPVKMMRMELGGGTITVNGSDGAITVRTTNGGEIFNDLVGTVTYGMKGRREIIYENGGIWSRYPSGGSVGVSDPRINLRKDLNNTRYLVISIVKINSSTSSTGGKGTVTLTIENSDPLTPIPRIDRAGGTAWINITSDVAPAWKRYFERLNDTMGGVNVVSSTSTMCNVTIQYDHLVLNNHTVDVRV